MDETEAMGERTWYAAILFQATGIEWTSAYPNGPSTCPKSTPAYQNYFRRTQNHFSNSPMPLQSLKVRHFRCFDAHELEFGAGMNFIIGPNAYGKTSLLEAVCILLRLQSPRITRLAAAIQHERRGFVVDGYFAERHMQFYFSKERKKLALDSVVQTSTHEYLQIGRVMWFSNADIDITRGGGEVRRRFLDFVCMQREPSYRTLLREYERALRSRNLLLKNPSPNWREIAAFDQPLVAAGVQITGMRESLCAELRAPASEAHAAISESREALRVNYVPGAAGDFARALAGAKPADVRLRQTTVGPHRDDLAFFLSDRSAEFASEGQQRTLVLALKLGAARLLGAHFGVPPVFLIDDAFGELDVRRRNALLAALPGNAQKIVTTTHLDWMEEVPAGVIRLGEG
jgi:DNA replication and repair protein RecF